jgi:hypothetical protein
VRIGGLRLNERTIIITLVFIAVSVPLIRPIGIPLEVTSGVNTTHQFIESLPAGSVAVMSFDCSAAGWAEVGAASNAMMAHLMSKGIKVIGISFNETGPGLFETASAAVAKKLNKTYGVDYVNLGFRAGGAASMAGFAQDIQKSVPKDYRGNDLSTLPMMQSVKTIHDVSLLVSSCSSYPGVDEWIAQVTDPQKVPIICISTAGQTPLLVPYMQSKQMIALLNGMRSGAEYELVNKTPGAGIAGMDVQSVMHLFVIALIILGNILYFSSKRTSKGGNPA